MHKVKIVVLFLQLFVSNFLIVLVHATLNYDCNKTLTGREHIVPIHYKLKLNFSEENGFISGESQIIINIQENIQRLNFDSFVTVEEVVLDKLKVNKSNLKEPYLDNQIVETIEPRQTYQLEDFGIVTVVFNELIQSGHYILRIKFSSVAKSTNTDGYIRASSNTQKGEVKWIIATQTRVKGPQAIIPCWDNPRIKTYIFVSIFHQKIYRAILNAQEIYQKSINDDDMIWSHFASAHAMSLHCLDIVLLPRFATYASDGFYKFTVTMPTGTQLQFLPDFDFVYYITLEVITYLEEQNLVDQCKVAETTYIPIGNFSRVILTTPTFILYRKENITVRNETSIEVVQNTANLIAEQITYQWILRSTNPLYWSSSLLKDVSNFLVAYLPHKVYPKLKIRYWQLQSAYQNYKFIYNKSEFLYEIQIGIIISKITSLCDI